MDAKVALAIVVAIIIIAGAAFYLAGQGGEEQAPTGTEVQTIQIGVLLPLTGDLASFGKTNQEAVKMAEADVNSYLEEQGANFRIQLVIVDTETKPSVALQKFDTLYQQGIRFFIGPMSSGELSEIVSEIKQNKEAVVISQSSTAPSLALQDTVYRFPPPDELQGKVLAELYQNDGVTHVIIVYRNDDWGSGLAGFVENYFTQFGGTVAAKIPYDPQSPNFDNLVQEIANQVDQLTAQGVAPENIGVELIAFEEASQILGTASQYSQLAQVKWYGSDGTALSQQILQNQDAASFAVQVKWKNTITFGLTDKTKNVYCALLNKLGYPPDPYSLIAYDAVWVMALAIQQAGGPDASVQDVANAIPQVVQSYNGVTGTITLNEYGDRVATDYGIFEIVEQNGQYQWVLTEIWKYQTEQFEQITENPLQCS